jgi:hypothetical protein
MYITGADFMTRLYLLCVLAFAPALALANDAPAAPASDASVVERIRLAENTADENEIVCERVASTGTRLATKVCKTRKQREEDRQRAKEMSDALNRAGGSQRKKGA